MRDGGEVVGRRMRGPKDEAGGELPSLSHYIRTDATYIEVALGLVVVSHENPKVAVLEIETADGALSVGLNEDDAEHLTDLLALFLTRRGTRSVFQS